MTDPLLDVLPWSLIGSPRDQRLYLFTLVLLAAGSGLAVLALWLERLDVLAALVAGAAVAGWLLSSAPGEGRTLLVLLPGNGLTTADLLAVPALVLVLLLGWRRLRCSDRSGAAGR